MIKQILPTKQGQIVKTLINLDSYEPDEAFLLADDPKYHKENDLVAIYSITEFQRCHAKGEKPVPNLIKLGCLTVIGENLKDWVESWN